MLTLDMSMSIKKKRAKDWYIAATHYLTAGFVIPVLGTFIFMLLYVKVFGYLGISPDNYKVLYAVANIPVFSVLVYFGVIYSSKFIRKCYIIPDAHKIIRLSSIYYLIVMISFAMLAYLSPGPEYPMTMRDTLLNGASELIFLAVFYFSSKKFVKANV